MTDTKNVMGEPLEPCSKSLMTGFYRDGSCTVGNDDLGVHAVCAQVTEEFLAYTKARGNDLRTPFPEAGFPGLKPGDRWCLCAARWKEALDDGVAPPVVMMATHEAVLEYVSLDELKKYALDFH